MPGVRNRPERDGHDHPAFRLGAPAEPALPRRRTRRGVHRDDQGEWRSDPFPRPAAAGERGGGGAASAGVTAHPAGAGAKRPAAANGKGLRDRSARGVRVRDGGLGARFVPGRVGTWRIALGPRAGSKVQRMGDRVELGWCGEGDRRPRCAEQDGFTLHGDVAIGPTTVAGSSDCAATS